MSGKPRLYIHVNEATHFLKWELKEFSKYFDLQAEPSLSTILLSFGPDVLEEAAHLPALSRFAVLFPGFRHNPLYDLENRNLHLRIIKKYFNKVFINPGPLQIAYATLGNVELYPFSIDTSLVGVKRYRRTINNLLHVSSDSRQKDWLRSKSVMKNTGLPYEVYPPRDSFFLDSIDRKNSFKNKLRSYAGINPKKYLPRGYVDHKIVVKKYQQYDAFVHIAKDIKDPNDGIDGKYTAAFIEAGLTGAILFWHDTYGLGNGLETVFDLPLDPKKAAEKILEIRSSINVYEHSRKTHEEIMRVFNPETSVSIRAQKILESI